MSFVYQKALFWLRRDLRLADNAALAMALAQAQKIAVVFVYDTQILSKLTNKADRRVSFLWESLLELRAELRALGSDLLILSGDPIELIPRLARSLGLEAVFTNTDYESYARTRDEQVRLSLESDSRVFSAHKDQILLESEEVRKSDGTPYTVFTPYKRRWLETASSQTPSPYVEQKANLLAERLLPAAELGEQEQRSIENLAEIGFSEASDLLLAGGRKAGLALLDAFAAKKIEGYKADRDFPQLEGTSDLSVHLRFGTVSARECFRLAHSQPDSEGVQTWISELIWREFYSSVLQAFGHVELDSFKAEYKNLGWENDLGLFAAWQEGRTGFPIVDAGMRQLASTGRMHNRVRMIVASFLVKDLLIDWRWGEKHFAGLLLDFDLASNNGGWQWAASTGTDAAPYFRIFNPTLQGERFDPQCVYIKKFVPELRALSASQIHGGSGSLFGYPAPIVDHKLRSERAKAMYKNAGK